jgi:hypothetical protein
VVRGGGLFDFRWVVIAAFLLVIVAGLSDRHPAPVCPQTQGNKVSLPDPPLRCVKTRNGWVCFEGGRDV